MSWTDNLQNPTFKTAVNKAIADGILTYDEMLALIKSLASGGVSASELSDLQSLYTNANVQKMFASSYVKEISYSLIYGDVANKSWWGGSKTLSGVVALGNLGAQTTELVMNRLIDKWFLGGDLPIPVAGGDTATGKASTKVYNYATASGALFVNGAAASDINQGSMGDCFLVAALGAIANAKQNLITDMFVSNPNGTYGVRYFSNSGDYFTTVNKSLIVNANGTVAGASNLTRSLTGEMWVSLAEKAYAQMNMQFDVNRKAANWNGENSYQSIEYGLAQTLKQVGNLNYVYYSSHWKSISDSYASGFNYAANAQQYKQTLINALNAGEVGWIGSWGATTGSNGKREFVSGHAYMLLGYNAATGKFIIRNPWGGDGKGDYNPQFEASIETFWNSTVKALVAVTNSSLANPIYKYSLTTDAASSSTAMTEGGSITISISRDTSGTSSTVFLSSIAGTATSVDFSPLEKRPITFAANELIKTFTIYTYRDAVTEGVENFKLIITNKANDTTALVETTAYLKDAIVTDYNYVITNNANSTAKAIVEGDVISFTITRSASGSASIVYVDTVAGSANSYDYVALVRQTVSFAANETSKIVTVKIQKDMVKENVENFSLALFKNFFDSAAAATSTAYIKDATTPVFNYAVTSNARTEASAVAEGGKVKFTITRDATGSESTIYVSTLTGSAGNQDYVGYEKKAVTFAANQTIATVEVAVNEDWWLESVESFRLGLYKNSSDTNYFTSASAFIKDAPVKSYQYTVTTANNSADKAIVEGGTLSFTITRDGTGTASTIYASTFAATANANDYGVLNRVAVSFAAFETTKTITVPTYKDELTEGAEYFLLNLYQNNVDASHIGFTQAYIKDAPIPNYTYSITSSAPDTDKAVVEGGNVVYIITRSASGTESTVYVSTGEGTAVDGDYTALNKQAVVFSPYEIIKTLTVNTIRDVKTEENEYFWLNLYKNYADTEFAAHASSYIKDAAATEYSYTVTTDAGSADKAVVEGGKITVTVTRSASGSASTIYLNSISGTAHGEDYAPFSAFAVNFAAHETVKTLTVNTYADNLIEGTEYLYIDLYKSLVDRVYTTFAKAFIKDAKVVNYDYTITSSAASLDTAAQEGSEISFTITRSASNGESTVYISAFDGTADSSDFGIFSKQAVIFAPYETSKVIKVNTFKDSVQEGSEYFWFTLYKNYSDVEYAAHASGFLADSTVTNYDYVLSSSAASEATAVGEGGKITVTVTRSASGTESTVYLSAIEGTANTSDYGTIKKQALTFAANETVKTITIDTYTDSLTEGNEFLWIELFKNYADLNYATYAKAYIKDVASTNYEYTVTSTAGSTSDKAVSEGDSLTYTITRSGSGSASTVYIETSDGSAGALDYLALTKQALNFASNETTKTVTVTTLKDTKTESTEYFWFGLFKNFSDTSYATVHPTYIKDVTAVNYDYTISSNASTLDAAVAEGGKITFTITRSSSGSASTVYLKSTLGTASASDVSVFDQYAVSFAANETVKSVTVDAITDSLKEDAEYFWVELLKNFSDQSYAGYAKAYVKDANASYDYSISSSAASSSTAASEGDAINFMITRSGSGTASTVYVSTENITTDASDFTALSKQAVSFSANETSKTISVTTTKDAVTESPESFWLNLYKNEADTTTATREQGFVKDVVITNYDYTITSNSSNSASAVVEGNKINVTITRSASGSASTVYISTTSGSANSSDYAAFSKLAINFAANETVKVVTIDTYADSQNEGQESFWIDLFKNQNDKDYLTYTKVYINDPGSGVIVPDAVAVGATGRVSPPATVAAANTFPDHATGEFKNASAFALLRSDGSVIAWGDVVNGGDVGVHAEELNGQNPVVQIFSASEAFAALRQDGSVVAWGHPDNGGDSSAVLTALNGDVDVKQVFSTQYAFAALLANGAVISWGNAWYGGDSSAVSAQLNGDIAVTQIFSNSSAFAAIRADGSVVTWGDDEYGGNSQNIAAQLNGAVAVTAVVASSSAFAALRVDGSVVTWGSARNGGDSSALHELLSAQKKVVQISATNSAFAALLEDGTVLSWGDDGFGGDSSAASGQMLANNPVQKIVSTATAFAALRQDGTVVSWGYAESGGSIDESVAASLVTVTHIVANKAAFAALRADGSVVTWGDAGSGGDRSAVALALDGKNPVTKIFATDHAFAALRADGSLITWGDALAGGDASEFTSQLDGSNRVTDVISNGAAFVALHADGSFVNWGDIELGGHSGGYGTGVGNVVSGANIYADDVYRGGTSVFGTTVSEELAGTWGSDVILSLEGNDIITGGIGHDKIDGGLGIDVSMYVGKRADFKINLSADGFVVSDQKGSEGIDSVTNIETLKFADMTINLTVGEKAKAISASALQSIIELYIAYFNRVPDADGMAYWITQYQAGVSIDQIGTSFYAAAVSPAFSALTGYSTDMSNADFIKKIYLNVLGRTEVDQGGMDYWSASLANGTETRGSLIKTIIGAAHGFKGNAEFGYVADLLDNKYAVGKYFSIEQGINYNTAEESYSKGVAIAALITATDTSAALALIGVSDLTFSLL